jgi:two-component system, cell cycle sensor histidine kinase and response regulator CckA
MDSRLCGIMALFSSPEPAPDPAERERLIASIAQQIRQSLHLGEILQTTVTEVRRWLHTDRVLVFRFAPDWSGTVLNESVGEGWTAILDKEIRDNCFAQTYVEPYRRGRVTAIPDLYTASLTPCYLDFLGQLQVQASLIVPIIHGESLWGLLIAHHCAAPRQWQSAEIEVLKHLAIQAAIAIQQSMLFEQLQAELFERQQTEIALRQSEQKFRAIFDGMFQFMGLLTTDGVLLEANRAALEAIDARLEDVAGQYFWQSPWWRHSTKFQQQLQEAIGKAAAGQFVRFEADHFLADGSRIIVDFSLKPVFDQAGNVVMLIPEGRDITEKKQIEAQIFRNQRLESLGTLASGIAHDLNNILTPILATAQILPLRNSELDPNSRKLLKLLESSARRGADLVKQILTFARGMEGEQSLVAVNDLLQEVGQIIKSTFPKEIEVVTTLSPQKLNVLGDATHLHQVLMNLCVNARDAMPAGGQLHLAAQPFAVDAAYSQMNLDAQVGSYVMISVSDTGIGIPAGIMERIFEPFFTTKETGQGTGLGLAITRGIINSQKGFITVESQEGQGSQFRIYLPSVDETALSGGVEVKTSIGHNELILVVDDEELIQEITKAALEEYGYQVMLASDGNEAIARYTQHQSKIAAVLIDIMMPGMNGITAIHTLASINPQVKIVAASGGMTGDKVMEATGGCVKSFLAKPYTIQELIDSITRTLA